MKMIPKIQYVVTKGSDDGTFEAGDHICLNENGSISCKEAMGWIDSFDVETAIVGMDAEVDMKWIDAWEASLKQSLGAIKFLRSVVTPEGKENEIHHNS